MAFKMKSGNKVSFKNMGSSPAKQDIDTSLDSSDADAIIERDVERKRNKELAVQIANLESKDSQADRTKRILEGKGTDADRIKAEKTRAEVEKNKKLMPWSKETKEYYADPDMAKYVKSRGELRADRNLNKELSRSEDSPGGKKITKEERYDTRTKDLYNKYKSAQGSGKQGVKFNWKDALFSGGGLAGGFSIGPKRDILAEKMIKRDTKKKSRAKVQITKDKTKLAKNKRKNQELEVRAKQAEENGNQKKADKLRKRKK